MNWRKEEWKGYMKKVTPRVLLRKLKSGKIFSWISQYVYVSSRQDKRISLFTEEKNIKKSFVRKAAFKTQISQEILNFGINTIVTVMLCEC